MKEILEFIQLWGTAIVSLLSLFIAIISLIQSGKAQELQNKVNELEIKIKKAEVEKIEQEKADERTTCVEAWFVNLGSSKHCLKVWNSGNAEVYNVTVKFADDPKIDIYDDKMPYEVLGVKKSFEVRLIVSMASSSKAKIITEWDDANNEHHLKEQISSW